MFQFNIGIGFRHNSQFFNKIFSSRISRKKLSGIMNAKVNKRTENASFFCVFSDHEDFVS